MQVYGIVICNTTNSNFITALQAFHGQFFNPVIPGLDVVNPGIGVFGIAIHTHDTPGKLHIRTRGQFCYCYLLELQVLVLAVCATVRDFSSCHSTASKHLQLILLRGLYIADCVRLTFYYTQYDSSKCFVG